MVDLTKKPYYLTAEQINSIHQKLVKMSTKEKIGQLFFVIGPDANTTDIPEFIHKYQPGGIMYRPDQADKIKSSLIAAQAASEIPLLTAANLESGGNGIVNEGTWFGTPLQVAASDNPDNAYELGNISGIEAQQVGTNMAFAPIVDIDKNFRNPIMNTRTFGSDQARVLAMSRAQIKGLHANKVIPVIKHFPGDGVDERDQHLLSSVNSLSKDDWMNSYGQIYQALIDEGIPGVMIAHIFLPAWEKALAPNTTNTDLRPASSSKLLINGLLRDVLQFNGLTITDATPMIGYNAAMPRRDLLPATINAGIDMILFNKNIDEDYGFITDAVQQGVITQERLNEAVLRILGTKMAQKIMTTDYQLIANDLPVADLHSDQALKAVAQLADESITLVKDRDNLLPLTPQKYPRIRLVILGDQDDGGFKEGGNIKDIVYQQLKERGFQVTLFDQNKLDFHEVFEEGVADLQAKFDLALYIANVETASNQTTTRLDWVHLMAADAPWFMKSIPTVFASTANPYHLFDIPNVSTFINAYTGNATTINALLDKLMGKSTFKGINPVDPFCGDFTTKL
ncbi:glycoside hydrolase family 3 protein [Bombilactobacillus thymidiniphilus]|uniref:beta-N-acetylhexosaminidase n=1 Tax=Bombilactobacillus thymidiniphilus TaxID=2923363 RepID=A0ABY4PDP4_9LACO|nr:glycoside hydrolase family 3 N-terminal domain-containing protein [Bombilactobacillus thymidiniphilus]UQS83397.1 glycoside hydrolase family 3 protein [Bombilactobacillus thymidiniphilus]